MLPEILRLLMQRLGNTFDPGVVREEYANYKDAWRLYLDLLEMDSAKLAKLIEAHPGETEDRLKMRQQIAAIFNYVPSILRMTINYLHSEEPVFDCENAQLKPFLTNCDGNGRSLLMYNKREALPLALAMGWIDTLVQRPATPDGMFVTAADVESQASETLPRVFTVTPLQRVDWSCDPSHRYNWLRFRDYENENPFPFGKAVPRRESFITISGFSRIIDDSDRDVSLRDTVAPGEPIASGERAFWLRSSRPVATDSKIINPSGASNKPDWRHEGGFMPMRRAPIATLYYQQSIDPDRSRRHFGISKIAMIAILTRKIIQLLSWTDEDVLANLALFAMPGSGKDANGDPLNIAMKPNTIIWFSNDAKVPPSVVQGETSHIDVKWKIIEAYIREILRLAFIIGAASAEAEKINSGVQGWIARSELFQELMDLAGSLDSFSYETLALAASWIIDEDVTIERLMSEFKPTVSYYKGQYSLDPLEMMIANSEKLITIFSDISPRMVEETYRQLAMSAMYNGDDSRTTVFAEIRTNARRVAQQRAEDRAIVESTIAEAAAQGATTDTGSGTESVSEGSAAA